MTTDPKWYEELSKKYPRGAYVRVIRDCGGYSLIYEGYVGGSWDGCMTSPPKIALMPTTTWGNAEITLSSKDKVKVLKAPPTPEDIKMMLHLIELMQDD